MQASGRIEPPPWLRNAETGRIIEALAAAGGRARFVGGAVRDSLLGRPVQDVDIASDRLPAVNMRALETAGIKVIPTGLAHGTITAVVEGRHFEITTLRRDLETDGRRAVVAPTDNWLTDARRRDFTFNALYLDPDGTLYDPLGGERDLAAGVVRFVGVAGDRIREDYLRILRFFRFHAWYGKAPPNAEALVACRELAAGLKSLSGERVRNELLRLLEAAAPMPAIAAMSAAGIWIHALAFDADAGALARLLKLEAVYGRLDAIGRLAALGRGRADPDLARRLRLSRAQSKRLNLLLSPLPEAARNLDRIESNRLVLRHGRQTVIEWALLDDLAALADRVTGVKPKPFPLSGRDVKALGLGGGPEIGRLLAEVEDWWLDHDFAPDRAACQAKLAEIIATG